MNPFPRLFLLSLLLVLSLLPDARAQAPAMRPPPVRPPPAHTPGYQPVTPADPVHTPAGAGASHGGLASPEKQAPRSPNKRLLPSTKEAGLWAADGAPVASTSERIFGIDIPDPSGSAETIEAAHACVNTVSLAAKSSGAEKDAFVYPRKVRACLAAWAYYTCAAQRFEAVDPKGLDASKRLDLAMFIGVDFANVDAVSRMLMHAQSIKDANCKGVHRAQEYVDILNDLHAAWLLLVRQGGANP